MFLGYSRLLVTGWLHEPALIPVANILHVNAALQYSPVLIQAYGVHQYAVTSIVPFPFKPDTPSKKQADSPNHSLKWKNHPAVRNMWDIVDLEYNCGYLTFANIGVPDFGCANRDPIVRLGRVYNKHFSPGGAIIKKEISSNSNCISNENFTFENENNTKNIVQEENVEKALLSPVESHFALTPVSTSETSSPANGFTNQECTDLLQQELDSLEIQENENLKKVDVEVVKAPPTADSLLSPTDEHIDMFLRSSSPNKEKEQIDDDVQNNDSSPNGEVS